VTKILTPEDVHLTQRNGVVDGAGNTGEAETQKVSRRTFEVRYKRIVRSREKPTSSKRPKLGHGEKLGRVEPTSPLKTRVVT